VGLRPLWLELFSFVMRREGLVGLNWF